MLELIGFQVFKLATLIRHNSGVGFSHRSLGDEAAVVFACVHYLKFVDAIERANHVMVRAHHVYLHFLSWLVLHLCCLHT